MDLELTDYQSFIEKELEIEKRFLANYKHASAKLDFSNGKINMGLYIDNLIPLKSQIVKLSIKIDHLDISLSDLSEIRYRISQVGNTIVCGSLLSNLFVNNTIRKLELDLNNHEIINQFEFNYNLDLTSSQTTYICIFNNTGYPIDIEIIYLLEQNSWIQPHTNKISFRGHKCNQYYHSTDNKKLKVINLSNKPAFILSCLNILDLLNITGYKIKINNKKYKYKIYECQSFEIEDNIFHLIPIDERFSDYENVEKYFFDKDNFQLENLETNITF